MTHETLRWEDVLRKTGHRVTRQRGVILDAVCAADGHTPLGDIYVRAHRRDPSLNRSTVYRALKLFVDVDLVVAADTGDGETYYEIKRRQHHHHLVCRHCGDNQEIDGAALGDMSELVEQQCGFRVATDHLVFFGICAQCRSVDDAIQEQGTAMDFDMVGSDVANPPMEPII